MASAVKGGEREKSTADLEKVTDHVEEKDSESLRKSVNVLLNVGKSEKDGKEGWAVKLSSEHVNFLMSELHMDKKEAENLLRQHEGDLLAVVKQIIKP
eukprot:jgi/Galph1/4980/GphlegSOOS_G3640.1